MSVPVDSVGGELLAQTRGGSVEVGGDRSLSDPQGIGGLAGVEVKEDAQGQYLALSLWEGGRSAALSILLTSSRWVASRASLGGRSRRCRRHHETFRL